METLVRQSRNNGTLGSALAGVRKPGMVARANNLTNAAVALIQSLSLITRKPINTSEILR